VRTALLEPCELGLPAWARRELLTEDGGTRENGQRDDGDDERHG